MSAELTAVEHTDDGMDVGMDVGPGTILGERYRLLRLLGEGGMGRVFLAHDAQDDEEVAVKVLTDDRPIPKAAARFEREAKAIARIEHDNVVRVSYVGQSPRGGLFYVMEYLQGEELAETLEREVTLPWERVRGIALQICSALQAAHERGVVHRDLKLENCFRITRGQERDFIKVLDFGVAKLLGPDADERLTNTGATVGTPVYMAPELCRGKAIDHRVDVYALGVMLFELLTGHLPFEGEGFLDVALQHMNDPPPPLTRYLDAEEIPLGLEAVVQRALAKDRADRFPTMSAFGRALERVGEPDEEPISADEEGMPVVARGGTAPALDAMSSPSITGKTQVVTGLGDGEISNPSIPSISAPIPLRPDEFDDAATLLVPAQSSRTWAIVAGLVALVALVALGAWWLQREPAPAPKSEEAIVVEAEETPAVVPSGSSGSSDDTGGSDTDASEGPSTGEGEAEAGGEAAPKPTVRRRRTLSRAQINAGLRPIRTRLQSCAGGVTGGKRGAEVRVIIRIDLAKGTVESAKATGSNLAVEGCVTEAIERARFERVGRGIQEIKKTFEL